MHTIVTADDEDIARKSLEFLIMSEIYDVQLVASAQNGAELIYIVEQYKPDLAIVDIDMPIINGIEAIKFLIEKGVKTRFILYTAYDDFNFMQQAIDLKISGYLLKADKREKSISKIKSIINDIDNMNEKQKKIDSLSKMEEKMIPILENEIMYSIFLDNPAIDSFNTWCNLKKVEFNGYYVISFIATSNKFSLFKDLIETKQFTKANVQNNISNQCHCISMLTKNNGCLVVGVPTQLNIDVNNWIINIMDNFNKYCIESFGLELIIGISDLCDNFSKIMDSYHNSLKILQNVIKSGVYQKNNEIELLIDNYKVEISKDILNILILGNEKKLLSFINSIIQEKVDSFYYLYELICKTAINYPSISNSLFCSLLSKKNKLKNHDNFNSFKKCLLEVLNSNINLLNKDNNPYVDRAIVFIKENAFDSNISLNLVADEIGISPFYLSRLLKNVLGVTFINMLTNMRMSKAIELVVDTRMQVQEISNSIGYQNTTYFCKVFKKYTGKSISEYRLDKLKLKNEG